MSHTVGMISLGCAKNQVNAEQMLYLVRQAGFEILPEPDGAARGGLPEGRLPGPFPEERLANRSPHPSRRWVCRSAAAARLRQLVGVDEGANRRGFAACEALPSGGKSAPPARYSGLPQRAVPLSGVSGRPVRAFYRHLPPST